MDPACWVQSRWFICSKGHVLVVHTSGRDSLLQLQFVRILIWWSILFVFFWMFSLNSKMVAWRKENALTVIYLCHHIWRHLKELSSCLIQKCKQLNKKAFFFLQMIQIQVWIHTHFQDALKSFSFSSILTNTSFCSVKHETFRQIHRNSCHRGILWLILNALLSGFTAMRIHLVPEHIMIWKLIMLRNNN